ncbi:MAG TPA: hypothetical protein VEZ24_11255 [Microvirga sp.]|nr:hypothetical protein [Microvirga sp.]
MMRKDTIAPFRRAVLTALMAYALVLQTILVSLGGAAQAADMAGNQGILCLQDGETRPGHDPATAHEGLCCTLSCHNPSAAGGPVPEAASIAHPAPVTLAVREPAAAVIPRLFSSVLPVGSRAPPRLA